jgi:hypothetical protein
MKTKPSKILLYMIISAHAVLIALCGVFAYVIHDMGYADKPSVRQLVESSGHNPADPDAFFRSGSPESVAVTNHIIRQYDLWQPNLNIISKKSVHALVMLCVFGTIIIILCIFVLRELMAISEPRYPSS